MIYSKESALSFSSCDEIVRISHEQGFISAGLLADNNSTYYDNGVRGGRVCFIDYNKLDIALIKPVIDTISEYKLVNPVSIDDYSFQVAEYNAGDIGFKWHTDDRMYPSLISGRKLTAIFELSGADEYTGGQLEISEISPNLNIGPPMNMRNTNINSVESNLNVVYHPVQYINQDPPTVDPTSNNNTVQEINIYTSSLNLATISKKGKGDCIIFPSFLFHRVTPIASGTRYSLTVWCKGPMWS
jgi:hypothetical protein